MNQFIKYFAGVASHFIKKIEFGIMMMMFLISHSHESVVFFLTLKISATTNQEEIRSKYLYFSTSSFMELTNLQEIIKTINIFHILGPKIFRETSFQT